LTPHSNGVRETLTIHARGGSAFGGEDLPFVEAQGRPIRKIFLDPA